MDGLVLSLFSGIGLLDIAFEETGFCVVRGPDQLWGGDIHTFQPPAGHFDGVIGGPPCQQFSRFAHIVRHRWGDDALAPDLIPEFARCVRAATPRWFLMENVPNAPDSETPGYAQHAFLLDNRWLGEEQKRTRRWVFGVRGDTPIDLRRFIRWEMENPAWNRAVLANGAPNERSKRDGSYRKGRNALRHIEQDEAHCETAARLLCQNVMNFDEVA